MRPGFCSQRVYKHNKLQKNYRRVHIQAYIIHRDCGAHQNPEGRTPEMNTLAGTIFKNEGDLESSGWGSQCVGVRA